MDCELCNALNEKYRLIKETKYSFAIICKCPLKDGHLLIMPKRHVSQNDFSNLSSEEISDLFSLIEDLQLLLNEFNDDDVILFKNSGKHSTESHFHFHLIPSKGALRELFAKYENIPYRRDIPEKDYILMKKRILNLID